MRRATLLIAVLALTPRSTVTAQLLVPLQPGDRVRITAPDVFPIVDPVTVVAVEADTLVVQHDPRTWRVPRRAITRLEVSLGRKSNAGRGAKIGALVLGIPGVITGLAISEICIVMCTQLSSGERVQLAALLGAIGAGTGALIGAVIGSAIRPERWVDLPLDQLRVTFAPQRDGRFALGLSVGF